MTYAAETRIDNRNIKQFIRIIEVNTLGTMLGKTESGRIRN